METENNIFPTEWYLKITEENKEIVNNWRKNIIKYSDIDCDYPYISQGGWGVHKNSNDLNIIIFEEFKKNVLNIKNFEEGKWYKGWDNYNKIACKYLKNNYSYFYFSERIRKDEGFLKSNGNWTLEDNLIECSLEEIQIYLPIGHPDKIKEWDIGHYVVAINNGHSNGKSSENYGIGNIRQISHNFHDDTFGLKDFSNTCNKEDFKWFVTLKEASDFSKNLLNNNSNLILKEFPKQDYIEQNNIIPEYVKYIKTYDISWKLNKIYKVDENGCVPFESGSKHLNKTYTIDISRFEPSTKEEYDKQEYETLGLNFTDTAIVKEKVDRNLLIKIEKHEIDKVFDYLEKQGEIINKEYFKYSSNDDSWQYIGFYNLTKKWTIAKLGNNFGTNIISAKKFLNEPEITIPIHNFKIGDLVEVKQNDLHSSDAQALKGKRFVITKIKPGVNSFGDYVTGYTDQYGYRQYINCSESGIYLKELKFICSTSASNIEINGVNSHSYLADEHNHFPKIKILDNISPWLGKPIINKKLTKKVTLLPLIEVKKRVII